MKILNLLSMAGLLATASAVHAGGSVAVPIPGLSNSGAGLAAGAADPKYQFTTYFGSLGTVAPPPTPLGPGYVTDNSSFPMNAWLPNNATSSWLTPSANQGASYNPSGQGAYLWEYRFDLSGYLPGTATITGRMLADNYAQIFGPDRRFVGVTSVNAFSQWTEFTVPADRFVDGVNTLIFLVFNTPLSPGLNPTGLRVEFTSSSVSPVPEPSALLLSLAGLALVGGLVRRRQSQAA